MSFIYSPMTIIQTGCKLFQSKPLHQYIPFRNAGHAKWQNIMHTKMANDAKKNAIRTRIARQMKSAIREGGSADPLINRQLAGIIEIAKNNQVPAENIQRILADSKDAAKNLKLIPYAVKGPGQCVIIIDTETDNTNRMRQEISTIGKKLQCSVVDIAGVLYLFNHFGIILCSEYNGVPVTASHLDTAVDDAIEAGAIDVNLREADEEYGTVLEFSTDPTPNTFYPVINALKDLKYKVTYSELEYIAHNRVELSDAQIELVSTFCEKVSSHQGVLRLFDNIA